MHVPGAGAAKPIQLANGTILAGTSWESFRNWSPFVDRSTDDGKTWTRSNPFPVPEKFNQIQPTLFEAKDGRIVALMRSQNPRMICRAESKDGGATFTPAEETKLANPSAGIDCVKTTEGDVFLIYNPTALFRSPISLARSTDDGKTWTKVADLETEPGEYSYPAMIQSAAGSVGGNLHVEAYAHQASLPLAEEIPELTPVRVLPSTAQRADLEIVRAIRKVMDEAVPVPGTKVKFGLDALLGLIPGVGDVSSAAIGAYILRAGARLGVPTIVLVQMLFNLLIDAVLGLIPVVGDFLDVLYRANSKNAALVEAAVANRQTTARSSWLKLIGVFAAFAVIVVGGIIGTVLLTKWAWNSL